MLKLLSVTAVLLLFTGACGTTSYEPPAEEQEEGIADDTIEDNPPVAADGILETVTWNLNWYGDGIYSSSTGRGPSDEVQQTRNILKVADSLRADLYAFQEVYSEKALTDITENMSGYSGFAAGHIDWIQKTAFVYNANVIDSVSSGAITDVRAEYQEQWDHYWAGRPPLYFQFTYEGSDREFYAVAVHAKAHTGSSSAEYQDAYERRKKAAEGLYYYLQDNKPDANIIFLGDYNDDVDESIYYHTPGDYAETPYYQFVNNSGSFDVLSRVLSENGRQSTVEYSDMIDHITISDELFALYVDGSVNVFQFSSDFISGYGQTTSDHYPVWAQFDLNATGTLARQE